MDSLESLPLRCYVNHGVIHISVGQDILAFATAHHPDFEDQSMKVVDAQMFALEVVQKINEEGEDGSTLLTRMLDRAISDAISDGAEGAIGRDDN